MSSGSPAGPDGRAGLDDRVGPANRARWDALCDHLEGLGSVVVALSGGVDSSLLATAAWRALGERMLAVYVRSPVETDDTTAAAQSLADEVGFPLRIVEYDALADPEFVANPPDRCYVCKRSLFRMLRDLADELGFAALLEGTNGDDATDYRPGRRALGEIGARSPLLDLGFTKAEIRGLARDLGLAVWNRPSEPCLASRFPYGSPVTAAGLRQIDAGERYLKDLGFPIVRVRHHGQVARIETRPTDIERLVAMRAEITDHFRSLGFAYVTLDLAGYRSGSLNEVLP
jgi:uncharacterized protein